MTAVTTSRLQSFEAISLPELVGQASLQTRIDRKYLIPAGSLDAVLARLDDSTRVLEIGGRRDCDYESIYFDTPQLDSYHLAVRGRRRRFKIRTRTYLDSATSYLEVKTRGSRSSTVKERIDHPAGRRDELTAEGLAYIDETLAATGIALDSRELGPVLSTEYARTTLFLPGSATRATIDTRLVWRLRSAPARVLDRPAVVVVETKSASRPSEVDRALWAEGHRPVSLSKYGTGMAAFRSELPANKWTRTLDRHFDRAPARVVSPR
ncbi:MULTISPECIES: polyphosphate polymerase domain-containing protein [unclassified Rathayibacter]|uniref:polyphosphate polymerase domain-containing protein n=1 Tax=unclassified Rathayibacter TaxID=2609250 RepID=UPI000F4BA9DB|nr:MULTISPECIES: polyphosphate polymerase domain-containing protein [unclassified Rathayibacter]ROP50137.1 VTC domain-containing protein [Rathayibacter sp. PhB186]ROS53095.1 VTC domain-containing protein [Rathayibacter sp. PhB185]